MRTRRCYARDVDRTQFRPWIELAAPLLLAALLVLLAVLQYRWLDQLAQREAEALAAADRAALSGAAALMERELADLVVELDRSVRRMRSGETPAAELLEDPMIAAVFWVPRGGERGGLQRLTEDAAWRAVPWVELVQNAPGWARTAASGEAVPTDPQSLTLHRSVSRHLAGRSVPGTLLMVLDHREIDRTLATATSEGARVSVALTMDPEPGTRSIGDGRLLEGQMLKDKLILVQDGQAPPRRRADDLRTRNLIVSSAVLMLLGAAAAMVWVGARRERRLARQRTELVAAVSHELRTPVAVLEQAGANLADGIVVRPEGVREYGALIVEQARRLGSLVEQALALGRATRSPRGSVPGVSELDMVIEQAVASMKGLDPEFELSVDDFGSVAVAVPEDELRRALENLMSNAARHGAEARAVVEVARDADGPVRVTVVNPAEPLSAEELARLGEAFFRPARSRERDGTGLGLALVRALIEPHGGQLDLSQADGRFRAQLVLPVVR